MSDDNPRPDRPESEGYTPPAYGTGYQPQGYEAFQPEESYSSQPHVPDALPETPAFQPEPSGPSPYDAPATPSVAPPVEARPVFGAPPPYSGHPWPDVPPAYLPPAPPYAPTPTYPPAPVDTDRKPWGPRRTVAVAALVAAIVGGGVGGGVVAVADNGKTVSSGITVTTQTAPNSARLDGTISAAAAKIIPSVVTISVSGQNEAGTGSGFVLREDGYILTNNHVTSVAGSGGSIDILTSDGRTAKASLVGADTSDDLAVIKVDLPGLKAATFAKSSALVVGQSVVAVGAPLGLSTSVTSGIVSNTARPVQTGDSASNTAVFNAIQTDAAINPGNSGGPLVNLNGDVVGVNAAIATANSGGVTVPGQSTQSGSIGIGFAIPSDEASRISGELIATGKATHAVIGVTVDQSKAPAAVTGATIASVNPGSPAAGAGLAAGDVVTKVNSQLITTGTDLVAAIRSYAPQSKVTLTYLRGGASHAVEVTLGTASS